MDSSELAPKHALPSKPTSSFWPFGQHEYIDYIIQLGETTVALLDDLKTKVDQVVSQQAQVDQAVTDLVAAVQNSAAGSDPAVQEALTKLDAVSTQQQADIAQDPGAPPVPAPPPSTA